MNIKIFQPCAVVNKMKQIDPGGYKRRRGGEVTIVSSFTKAMFIFLLFVPVCFGQARERVQFRISGEFKNILHRSQQFVVPCFFNDLKFYPFIKPKSWVTTTLSGTVFVIVYNRQLRLFPRIFGFIWSRFWSSLQFPENALFNEILDKNALNYTLVGSSILMCLLKLD